MDSEAPAARPAFLERCLTAGDCQAINESLRDLNDLIIALQMAGRADIDMTDRLQQAQLAQDRLMKIKQQFFPHMP